MPAEENRKDAAPCVKQCHHTKAEMHAFCEEQEQLWLRKVQDCAMAKLLKSQQQHNLLKQLVPLKSNYKANLMMLKTAVYNLSAKITII
jgi:hypothetical protein